MSRDAFFFSALLQCRTCVSTAIILSQDHRGFPGKQSLELAFIWFIVLNLPTIRDGTLLGLFWKNCTVS